MFEAVDKFLKQLIHNYTPIRPNQNFLIDEGSVGDDGSTVVYEGGFYFNRHKPSPPEVCSIPVYPGQPESRLIVSVINGCQPYPDGNGPSGTYNFVVMRYEYKSNHRWVTKSVDSHVIIHGIGTSALDGSINQSQGVQPCNENPFLPYTSNLFTIDEWETLFQELQSEHPLGGQTEDFIKFLRCPPPDEVTNVHPLCHPCDIPGYWLYILDDYFPVTPFPIPIVLPKKADDIVQAFIEITSLLAGMLGIEEQQVINGVIDFANGWLIWTAPFSGDPRSECYPGFRSKVRVAFRYCECPPGLTYTRGACVEELNCGPCQEWNDVLKECVDVPCPDCPDGQYLVNGECVQPLPPCPPGYVYSATRQECYEEVPPDPENPPPPYDPDTDPPNPGDDPDWPEWKPPTPDDPDGDPPCDPVWDPVARDWILPNGDCPCGTVKVGDECLPRDPSCPPGMKWDGVNCVPDIVLCPPQCYWDGTKCVCPDPDTDYPDPDNPYQDPYDPDPDDVDPPYVGPQDPPRDREPPPRPPEPPVPPVPELCWYMIGACAPCLVRCDPCDRRSTSATYLNFNRIRSSMWIAMPIDDPNYYYTTTEEVNANSCYDDSPFTFNVTAYHPNGAAYFADGSDASGYVGVAFGPSTVCKDSPRGRQTFLPPKEVLKAAGYPDDFNETVNRCTSAGDRQGTWEIYAYVTFNPSSTSCFPNPLIQWFVDRFLDMFGVFNQSSFTKYDFSYAVFDNRMESDGPPTLEVITQTTYSFLHKGEYKSAFTSNSFPWTPCINYSLKVESVKTKFIPD